MHLTGKSDADNFFAAQISLSQRFFYSDAAGSPPIFGMLFGPSKLRRGEPFMIFRGGGNDLAALAQDQSSRAARTDVDP